MSTESRIEARDAKAAGGVVAEGRQTAVGWLYVSDDGIEWSDQHPVRSGQVPDARLIRRATHAELLGALKEAWEAHGEAVQGEAEYARRWRETADALTAAQAREAALRTVLRRASGVLRDYMWAASSGGLDDEDAALLNECDAALSTPTPEAPDHD